MLCDGCRAPPSPAPPSPAPASTPVLAPVYESSPQRAAVQDNSDSPNFVCHSSGGQSICYLSGMTANYLRRMIENVKADNHTPRRSRVSLKNSFMCQQEGDKVNPFCRERCETISNPVCISDEWNTLQNKALDYNKLMKETKRFEEIANDPSIKYEAVDGSSIAPETLTFEWGIPPPNIRMHAGRHNPGNARDLPMLEVGACPKGSNCGSQSSNGNIY